MISKEKLSSAARLDLMLADMESAPSNYRPTNFWQSGLQSIVRDLENSGFENFREHPSAIRFYAPTFRDQRLQPFAKPVVAALRLGKRINRIRRIADILQQETDGTGDASRQLGILKASLPMDAPEWALVSESTVGGGERFEFDGRTVSKSLLNYLLGLSLMHRTAAGTIEKTLEIGGGYGTLGEIILKASSDAFYVNVDIPPVAAVSSYYLEQVFGSENVLTYEQSKNLETIDIDLLQTDYRAAVLCPWQLERLTGSFDMFANFISFQEMEPDIVRNYVDIVCRLQPANVLLRNSAVGKTKVKTGQVGVLTPTTTEQMIGWFDDYTVVGRDGDVFGETSRDGRFVSEVIVLKRRY